MDMRFRSKLSQMIYGDGEKKEGEQKSGEDGGQPKA